MGYRTENPQAILYNISSALNQIREILDELEGDKHLPTIAIHLRRAMEELQEAMAVTLDPLSEEILQSRKDKS